MLRVGMHPVTLGVTAARPCAHRDVLPIFGRTHPSVGAGLLANAVDQLALSPSTQLAQTPQTRLEWPQSPSRPRHLTIRSNAAQSSDAQSSAEALNVLMQACGTGNRVAFEAVYRATSSRLFGICLHYSDNRAEAEEVLQEVYIMAWVKASGFDPRLGGAMTWLSTMARHKAIDRRRAHRRHDPLETIPEPASQDSFMDTLEREQQGSQLDRCLETLEEAQRRYIRVAFFEGYSYAELAERHGIALGTMKSWIRRGLLRLRVCLGL
jgi:RNA polymerase sigma-70 factor (ECF subfamily)